MRLYVYRDRAPNFGDDLNDWLFPRLLPTGFFDNAPDRLFLGIGSILFDSHPASALKIVFGSGYGGYTKLPRLDQSWDIRFVRGHMTAEALGLDRSAAVGDSAILISTLGMKQTPVRGRRIYIPHLDSAIDGSWDEVATAAGLRFVDPRRPVVEILNEILSAEVVVTEAMHGAIVADSLRVPWVGVEPLFAVHRAKWHDWASVLGINPKLHRLRASNLAESLLLASAGRRDIQKRIRWHFRSQQRLGSPWLRARAVGALTRAAAADPQLSPDTQIKSAATRMSEELDRLRSSKFG